MRERSVVDCGRIGGRAYSLSTSNSSGNPDPMSDSLFIRRTGAYVAEGVATSYGVCGCVSGCGGRGRCGTLGLK